jgi:hypothetical protein
MPQTTKGAVAYLTTIPVAGSPKISLWRVVAARERIWYEQYGEDGWREDAALHGALDAAGTVRLTPSEARCIARETYGVAW